jgi:hypothetical protein
MFDYWFEPRGAHNITQGYDGFIGVYAGMLAGTASYTSNTYKVIITNLPPYMAIHWPDQEYNGLGQGTRGTTYAANDTLTQWSFANTQFQLVTNVGGTTPSGSYTLHITVQTNNGTGPAKDVPWTLNVVVPTSIAGTPSAYPAIPCLGAASKQMDGTSSCSYNWEQSMVTYGQKWCASNIAPGNETGVWYYDGERVYFQIKDYDAAHNLTRNPAQWDTCTQTQEANYRPYVISTNGAVPGYRNFAEGLYQDWVRNGDTTSRDTASSLTKAYGLWAGNQNPINPVNVRELSYYLNTQRIDTRIGNSHAVQIAQAVSTLLGQIDQITAGTADWYQPFMMGLMSEALIKCYEDSSCPNYHDPRIPVALKSLADLLWANAWNVAWYQQGAFIYNSYQQSIGVPLGANDMRGLNLLIAPLYAWLFKTTGVQTYQVQADTVWQAGVTMDPGNGMAWAGKNYSQNYRWSPDFVAWRSRP